MLEELLLQTNKQIDNNNNNRQDYNIEYWESRIEELQKVLMEKERIQSDRGLAVEELKANIYEQEEHLKKLEDEERYENTLIKSEAKIHTM